MKNMGGSFHKVMRVIPRGIQSSNPRSSHDLSLRDFDAMEIPRRYPAVRKRKKETMAINHRFEWEKTLGKLT